MTSVARVEKISKDRITVSTVRKGACGDNCAMCGACNAEKVLTEVYSDVLVNIGDTVRIKSDSRYVVFALCCLFLLPVCAPLLTYVALGGLNLSLVYVFTAFAFLLSVGLVVVLSKSAWFVKKITPVITDIIKKK